MNDAEIVKRALKIKSQDRGPYVGDTVMDALSDMWDGVDGPMSILRKFGLSPDAEANFWNNFEDLLDNLKNTMPGIAVGARKRGQVYLSDYDGEGQFQAEYEVMVGNIGSVIRTPDFNEALKVFDEYVQLSESGYGRVGGEDVTLLAEDGEVVKEYFGSLRDEEDFD